VIEIRGGQQLAALSKAVAAAEKNLQRDLIRAEDETARAVIVAAKDSALRTLPRRGRMATRVAAARFSTKRRRTFNGGGIRVIATSEDSLRLIDRKGVIRHPVFGNRDVWVSQKVPAHWWTRPTESVGRRVGQRELVKAVGNAARTIKAA
jgi:hypothetical protein